MTLAGLTRCRWLVGTLLLMAAALFTLGVAVERNSHHETAGHDEASETAEAAGHDEAGESSEAPEGGAGHEAQAEAGEPEARVLGLNLESTPLVAAAVALSVVLAAATWRTDNRPVLAVTALFALAFALLDLAELSRQIRESAATVAVIAAAIAVAHVVSAVLAHQRRSALSRATTSAGHQ